MNRKTKERSHLINARIEEPFIELMDSQAKILGLTRSDFIKKTIRFALENLHEFSLGLEREKEAYMELLELEAKPINKRPQEFVEEYAKAFLKYRLALRIEEKREAKV